MRFCWSRERHANSLKRICIMRVSRLRLATVASENNSDSNEARIDLMT